MFNSKIVTVLSIMSIIVIPKTVDDHNACTRTLDPETGIKKWICNVGLLDPELGVQSVQSQTPNSQSFEQTSRNSRSPQQQPVKPQPPLAIEPMSPSDQENPDGQGIPEQPASEVNEHPDLSASAPSDARQFPKPQPSEVIAPKTEPAQDVSAPDIVPSAPVTVKETLAQCNFLTLGNQANSSVNGSRSTWETEVIGSHTGVVVAMFSQENCKGCEYINKRVNEICSDYPHVKFVEVEHDNNPKRGLFNDYLIVFTPTFIMFRNGESMFKVTGANSDCVEVTAGIADAWTDQARRTAEIERALAGHSLCSTAQGKTRPCRLDQECRRKLSRLL